MKSNIIEFSSNVTNKSQLATSTIFRRDRTIIQNIKRFWIVFARDNIYPYLYNENESHYNLIKERRGL